MSNVANVLQGRLSGGDAAFRGLSTDSRTLSKGELFVALQGPNFDGTAFAGQAKEQGAAGIVAPADVDAGLPCVTVDDTRVALGRIASDWRRQQSALLIAVTGSNGKTTLKELIASCLSPLAPTLATAGNLNNDIGLPLMLARLSREHEYAVLEMGANHAGEIAYLVSLATPAIVAITNAGPAHLEGFGSIEGVAKAKGEILQGEPRPAAAVLNADDDYFELWCDMASDLDVTSFGYADTATVRILDSVTTATGSRCRLRLPEAEIEVDLPLAGSHNVLNACAAAAVCYAAGVEPQHIRKGLESVRPVDGRLRPIAGKGGVQLYDDSYNANPASVVAAAGFIATGSGPGWLVLGDMGELGKEEVAMHRAVGADIRKAGVARLLATGPLSRHAVEAFGDGGEWFESVGELIEALQASLTRDLRILVKGSRVMRMERVINALRDDAANGGGR